MISHIILNKSKDKTLVFIHGFYANSGYWLPYLTHFKEYRIFLMNVDYLLLLSEKDRVASLCSHLKKYPFGNEVVGVVSHSLGTVVSAFLDVPQTAKRFEICPVAFGDRVHSQEFIDEIKLRVNEAENQVASNLMLVDRFISESREAIVGNKWRYVPDADQYFSYHVKPQEQIVFKGDHFEVESAIADIAGRI